jgi:hypothetical protein
LTDGAFRAPERAAAERALELTRRLAEVEAQLAIATSRHAELAREAARGIRSPRSVPGVVPLAIGFLTGLAAAGVVFLGLWGR